MNPPALELKDVGYCVSGKTIVKGISLSLNPGDFCLLFGPNGAGKTTLLRIMAGLLQNHSGRVMLGGRDVKNLSWNQQARIRAYLGQNDDFSLPVTVREILVSGRYAYSKLFSSLTKEDQDRMDWAVDLFGLSALLDRDIQVLSGGERKRVLIASAFVQDVRLIFLDEPLNFLDPAGARQVLNLLRDLNRQGRTIVVISHALELFFPYANQLAAMKNGNLLYAGERKFLPDLLRDVYQVDFKQARLESHSLLYWHEP